MEKAFEKYLISKGYKLITPSGKKSTVPQYVRAVDKVCEIERLTWGDLAKSIDNILPMYDKGGAKEDIGNKSNKTYINALKRFRECI